MQRTPQQQSDIDEENARIDRIVAIRWHRRQRVEAIRPMLKMALVALILIAGLVALEISIAPQSDASPP